MPRTMFLRLLGSGASRLERARLTQAPSALKVRWKTSKTLAKAALIREVVVGSTGVISRAAVRTGTRVM